MIQIPEWSREIVREGISGKSLTTFGVGGPVPFLFEPRNHDEALAIFKFLKADRIPYKIIGNGSNLVLPDEGMGDIAIVRLTFRKSKPKLIIQKNSFELDSLNLKDVAFTDKVILDIPASISMMNISRQTSELGLSGLEYSAGIPGTLGGAVRMNAGAHGAQISDILVSASIWDENIGEIVEYQKGEDLSFSYRHCNLSEGAIILSAKIELTKKDVQEVRDQRSSALKYRKETQPLSMPSAGSVFRNPTKELSAAKILDDLGCKGARVGGVRLSEMHSNWIVRVSDEARASDIKTLVDSLKEHALKNTGISLEEEIIFW